MIEPKKYGNLKFPGMPDKRYRENLDRLVKADATQSKRSRVRRGAAASS